MRSPLANTFRSTAAVLDKRPDNFLGMDDFVVDLNAHHRTSSSGPVPTRGWTGRTSVLAASISPAGGLSPRAARPARGLVLPAPGRAQASPEYSPRSCVGRVLTEKSAPGLGE
jgi:hypothetical protein